LLSWLNDVSTGFRLELIYHRARVVIPDHALGYPPKRVPRSNRVNRPRHKSPTAGGTGGGEGVASGPAQRQGEQDDHCDGGRREQRP
jgi:hypothetical protein